MAQPEDRVDHERVSAGRFCDTHLPCVAQVNAHGVPWPGRDQHDAGIPSWRSSAMCESSGSVAPLVRYPDGTLIRGRTTNLGRRAGIPAGDRQRWIAPNQ